MKVKRTGFLAKAGTLCTLIGRIQKKTRTSTPYLVYCRLSEYRTYGTGAGLWAFEVKYLVRVFYKFFNKFVILVKKGMKTFFHLSRDVIKNLGFGLLKKNFYLNIWSIVQNRRKISSRNNFHLIIVQTLERCLLITQTTVGLKI